MNLKTKLIASSIIAVAGLTACSSQTSSLNVTEDLTYCDNQLHKALSDLKGPDGNIDYKSQMPRNISGNATEWSCAPVCAQEWCSGFWPGILWYDYENTKDSTILVQAEQATEAIKQIVDAPVYDHDLGFLTFCSYGNAYRLTGKEEYRQAILNAADSLATLFNPKVGTICSWPRNVEMFGGHNTIMDNMINLEMLFWAAKNSNNHKLYDIAVSHAEKTMHNQFRADYSCYHVAVYNPETGEFIRGCNHQGYSDDSMWARGQAWAIYGYTMVYRETREPRFLDFAQKVANVYLSRLPEDKIPYWDFDDPRIPNAPKDASAACVVASALLELSEYVGPEQSKKYFAEAEAMLTTLRSDEYRSDDTNDAFLLHSVGNHPAGTEIDYSIVYADYYYIEALTRLRQLEQSDSYLATSASPHR
jgi:unsaturated chondroitin disaccharide hydrolase